MRLQLKGKLVHISRSRRELFRTFTVAVPLSGFQPSLLDRFQHLFHPTPMKPLTVIITVKTEIQPESPRSSSSFNDDDDIYTVDDECTALIRNKL